MTPSTPLPCPWCGHEARATLSADSHWVRCASLRCAAEGPSAHHPGVAVTEWNRVCRLVERGRQMEKTPLAEMSGGQFRRFVAACQNAYPAIYVWEDWNPMLGPMLERYGFVRCTTTEDGEDLVGLKWERNRG